jgi:hypothetical protein
MQHLIDEMQINSIFLIVKKNIKLNEIAKDNLEQRLKLNDDNSGTQHNCSRDIATVVV